SEEAWMRARLEGEGALLARLAGRGAPRLVAQGQDAAGPWIVMERVGWGSLEARTGGVDAAWVGRATRAAFAALEAVHAQGIVHGDVSPGNVLAADDGARAVLVDFGLALGPGMPAMPPGPFRGTLAYAAPEVARGEPCCARADLFAMAATLLHVASGEPPRRAPTGAAMLLSAAEVPIEPWASGAANGLDLTTARALVACCAFDPALRPDHLGAALAVP
ncbi:MAG: protein kinase domain-containing protein, partial [Polyangiaceae bacterium]